MQGGFSLDIWHIGTDITNWFIGLPWQDIGIACVIFVFFLVLRKIFTTYVFKFVSRYTTKSHNNWDNTLLESFKKPLRVFFVAIGLYLALKYLPLKPAYDASVLLLFRTVIIIFIGWGLYNLTNSTSAFFSKIGAQVDVQFDAILLPFLSKVLRFIIIALTIAIIASEWDFQVGGFVAGLGLGGLAFALAAQEMLKNLFGGIVIITEKPFTIGDWIFTESVEGVVEDINFRSTKVRTFAHAVVTVPNSTLANQAITNWSKMGKRRIMFHLGVTYSTPKTKLEKCVHDIRIMLQNHTEIDQERIMVYFDKFNDSSLDIFLYFFTKTTDWAEWVTIKEDCNLKIIEILEKEGVSVAFPSRSIYVEENKKATPVLGENRQAESKQAETDEHS